MKYRPEMIISGGQTGADMGGLIAAESLGIPTGGVAPKGFKTEDGPNKELETRFHLTESDSTNYVNRTVENILKADATIIFSEFQNSPGTMLTFNCVMKHNKTYYMSSPHRTYVVEETYDFLAKYRPRILNISGNREGVCSGITMMVAEILTKAFEMER